MEVRMVIAKIKEKEKAIKLRKKGLSYNEIRKKVAVSKSSLSLWLRSVNLTKRQMQRFTEKKRRAQEKARKKVKELRIKKTKKIINKARKEIGKIVTKDLKIIGTILYWAEGCKQKENNISQSVQIGNSDPIMIILLIDWLIKCCNVKKNELQFRILIHETANIKKEENYWKSLIGCNYYFLKPLIKKHEVRTNRKINKNYHGLLEIRVRKSTDLNRKITGWVKGITKQWEIV